MSTLQVANIHLESTQNNRFQYLGSNNFALVAGGSTRMTVNSSAVSTNGTANFNDGPIYLNTTVFAASQGGANTSVSGGFGVSTYSLGTLSSGTTTLNPFLSNYQYYTSNGAHTIAAPASDCAIDILVTNGASAGTITLSGFTAPSGGGGDTYATTNANRYMLMVRRINGISTYSWKALQ